MASTPDNHPDSVPSDTSGSVEQESAGNEPRQNVEDSAGDFAGTSGTGGENKVQDRDMER